jgi:branched-chain amino acid transport system ATP-binding protein
MALLETRDLTIKFGGLLAVSKLNLKVNEGEIHSLIGPNGAGKTTVFNAITRVINPTSGDVVFNDENLLKHQPHQTVKIGISRTFQNLEIFKLMSVMDNFLVGYHSRLKTNWFNEGIKTPRFKQIEKNAEKEARKIADFLGMENRLNSFAGMLPYGLQKMVEIGRALMSEPKIILLDEPAAGLNNSETKELKKIIFKIKEKGITILIVEHDMSLVMDISENITVMNFGKKIAEGNPEKIRNNKDVIEAYLGESKYA